MTKLDFHPLEVTDVAASSMGPARYHGHVARKPTLSPSKISTYLACPVKYRWTYMDSRGKWFMRSRSYFSFGISLHQVLQRFHDSDDAGVTTTHEAISALEDSWLTSGYSSQDEMQQALAEGKEIVQNYTERIATQPVTSKTLYVEKQLRREMADYALVGILDRVDEREDGVLEIIDYKSGRSSVTSLEVHDDLAMSIYQILLQNEFPNRRIEATIIALRTGNSASAHLTPDEQDLFVDDVSGLAREIIDRDYENITPILKPICGNCDFLPLCQKHPEFAEEMASEILGS